MLHVATILQNCPPCVVVVAVVVVININFRDLLILFQNETYKINRYQIWYVTILDSNYLIHYPPLTALFIIFVSFYGIY